MNKVSTIHHIKALTVASHIVKSKLEKLDKELTVKELIEVKVAIQMVIDDLTRDAVVD